MPETGGRGAGEGRQNPKGVVDTTEARYRWSYLPGELDALKGARPVREEVVGNVPKGNALATYFIQVVGEAVLANRCIRPSRTSFRACFR